MEEGLPAGFRFHPTDEELITYYLRRKFVDFGYSPLAVADVNLNRCEPWELPAKAKMGEKEWYFFSMKDRKYPTGQRTNRATDSGYWKTTGKDREIYSCGGAVVGMKKTLVFYKGRAPRGEKTNWVMHEYRNYSNCGYKPAKEEWVVCRVFMKSPNIKKQQLPHLDSPARSDSVSDDPGDLMGASVVMNNLSAIPTSPAALTTNYIADVFKNSTEFMDMSRNNKEMEAVNTYVMNWASGFLGQNLLAPESSIPKITQLHTNNTPAAVVNIASAQVAASWVNSDLPSTSPNDLESGSWPMSTGSGVYAGSIWHGY